ncbi:HAD hydrolase-like protein [Flavihumibacter sp. UBA7668]|uniref:HAD hydrolase-like protein n=1 Tax=Flavihumibacter sp. UBA7668 TaxID=1946542 RepID=UPI0025C12A6C|nr:HAD hydrolase-like protein [Flavihumibacter sp. UBA7668]
MSTDILGADTMGFTTVLTLSVITKRVDLEQFSYAPDFVIDSIKDLLEPGFFQDVIRKKNRYNSFE